MKYYTIQNNALLIADNEQALTRFYDNVYPLPADYQEGKYIIVEGELVLNPNWDVEELAIAKAAKYEEALTGAKNFIDNDAAFQYDENNSIEATDGNIGKMTAFALGFQTGTIESVSWTSKEDNVLILDAQDVLRILTGLGEIQGNVWNVQFVGYKNAIENAVTVADVEAIIINYGDNQE